MQSRVLRESRRRLVHTLAGMGLALAIQPAAAAPPLWVGEFAHSPTAYNRTAPVARTGRDGAVRLVPPGYAPLPPYPKETTVREFARTSSAVRSIRIRLSNEFGESNLRIGEAHVALALDNGEIVPGSDHVLTFAGKGSALIPAGAPILSDPVDWNLPALSKLAVTLFYPDDTVPPAHTLYTLQAWAAPGNQAAAQKLDQAAAARSGNHLSEIDGIPAGQGHTVVCLGDSITEGVASTPGAFRGWVDRLAERLQANPATRGWSVVNAGIGSNRLLHDTPSVGALARFDRDILSVPNVGKIIIFLGINDIQYGHRNSGEAVSADEMMAALAQLASRAHAHGIEVIGGTITPFDGSPDYTPEGEAARNAVNAWIRTSKTFDHVVDFDRAVRDPNAPTKLLGAADSGGHLHPGDAGYAMMGDAIDLGLFAK